MTNVQTANYNFREEKKNPKQKLLYINIDNCLKLGHKSLARNMYYFLFLITPSTVAEEGKWFKLFFNYSFFLSVKKNVFFCFFISIIFGLAAGWTERHITLKKYICRINKQHC